MPLSLTAGGVSLGIGVGDISGVGDGIGVTAGGVDVSVDDGVEVPKTLPVSGVGVGVGITDGAGAGGGFTTMVFADDCDKVFCGCSTTNQSRLMSWLAAWLIIIVKPVGVIWVTAKLTGTSCGVTKTFGMLLYGTLKITVVWLSPAFINAVPAVSAPTIICPVKAASPTELIVNKVVDELLTVNTLFPAGTFAKICMLPLAPTNRRS